jgi:hypothetical protein
MPEAFILRTVALKPNKRSTSQNGYLHYSKINLHFIFTALFNDRISPSQRLFLFLDFPTVASPLADFTTVAVLLVAFTIGPIPLVDFPAIFFPFMGFLNVFLNSSTTCATSSLILPHSSYVLSLTFSYPFYLTK